MIRIAFWYDRPVEYTGGLNYIRNLLYAISKVGERKLDPFVFFGSSVNQEIIRQFEPYATIVRTSVLDKDTIPWLVNKILFRLTGSLFFVNRILSINKIQVVSHAVDVFGKNLPYKIVYWLPDFQPLHLPQFFPHFNLESYNKRIRIISENSDVTVLSSRSAWEDFQTIAPEFVHKTQILPFVSQPQMRYTEIGTQKNIEIIRKKFSISKKYFFLPNQFWQHKNHQVVFEAVRILKSSGKEILVICTGNLLDYRSKDIAHASSLMAYIKNNNLSDNIKILGKIDYEDVLLLMRNSISVINPSFFEGWSSSVEEAKSMGKPVILSNLKVHLEQAPPGGVYFDPNNPSELARLMEEVWENSSPGPDLISEKLAEENLDKRTIDFGEAFQKIILHLFQEQYFP